MLRNNDSGLMYSFAIISNPLQPSCTPRCRNSATVSSSKASRRRRCPCIRTSPRSTAMTAVPDPRNLTPDQHPHAERPRLVGPAEGHRPRLLATLASGPEPDEEERQEEDALVQHEMNASCGEESRPDGSDRYRTPGREVPRIG